MQFRDGTPRQKALFCALVGVYVLAVLVAFADKMERVGAPDVGWMMDGAYVSPTRPDAAEAGLRGGGRALRINGADVQAGEYARRRLVGQGPRHSRAFAAAVEGLLRREVGAHNTLTFRHPSGALKEITLPVRLWTWDDVIFTEGATLTLGLLFVVVGIGGFLLRPYQVGGWGLLALATVVGGMLTIQFVQIGPAHTGKAFVLFAFLGFISVVPFHAGLAFPVVHPLLARHPRVVAGIYAFGLLQAVLQIAGLYADWAGPLVYADAVDTLTLVAALTLFLGRCLWLAVRTTDALTAQRARIMLAGTLLGCGPPVFVNFMRDTFGLLTVDLRIASWPLGIFILAVAYVTVRQDLVNARVAVRRAVIYATAVGVLTATAIFLVSLKPYAVALLLLPLLYLWPEFEEYLNAWLYPQRAHFPELLRGIGDEMAAAASVDAVLAVLAAAPARLCDARSSVAFLLPRGSNGKGQVRVAGGAREIDAQAIANEALVQLVTATRKEVHRGHIAVDPQYSNIKGECYATFDRLGAELLLPLLRKHEVIGGLAIGPRASGDVYEAEEVGVLSTAAQQAVQALIRVEATEELHARDVEISQLKRFFPPQIIDQVVARGGAAELRTQRKLVSVLFADLRGFTSFSDSVEPEEVMATLAEYYAAMGQRIVEFAGTLERFAGDGFMVFFNDPVEQPDHVERTVRMALAMRADIEHLRQGWVRRGYQIDVGMGAHSGYATCGFIGYEGRRDYSVIGNVSNLAARLSDVAGPGEILISARLRGELRDGYRTEPVGELTLKGFRQPQAVFRLLAG